MAENNENQMDNNVNEPGNDNSGNKSIPDDSVPRFDDNIKENHKRTDDC